MSKRTRLLIAVIVVAGLAGQGGVGYALWRAHVNRQPTVSDDIPYLDQAIAATVAGAGDAAVAIAGIVQAAVCQPALLISGGEFTRAADLYTDPGDEDALITRIADLLPTDYHAQRPTVPAGQVAPLLADPGHGVHLSVRRLGEGWVVATARTGCTSPAHQKPTTAAPTAGVAAVEDLLATLGTRAAQLRQETLPCPTGSLVTATGISQPTTSGNLADRLAAHLPKGAHPYATTANRVAYRTGPTSVIVAASDDATAITVRYTTGC